MSGDLSYKYSYSHISNTCLLIAELLATAQNKLKGSQKGYSLIKSTHLMEDYPAVKEKKIGTLNIPIWRISKLFGKNVWTIAHQKPLSSYSLRKKSISSFLFYNNNETLEGHPRK
jgi:hypothetical protein